jgi:hypothetical protein
VRWKPGSTPVWVLSELGHSRQQIGTPGGWRSRLAGSLVFVVYLIAAMMIAIIFFSNDVFARGKTSEIVSVTEFSEPVVGKSIVILSHAPDIQIEIFVSLYRGLAPSINIALKNGVTRVSNIGIWGNDVISGQFGLINWEGVLFQVAVVAQYTFDLCANVLGKYFAAIDEADPPDDSIIGIEHDDAVGLRAYIGAQFFPGGAARNDNLPKSKEGEGASNKYKPLGKVSKIAGISSQKAIIHFFLFGGLVLGCLGIWLLESRRCGVSGFLTAIGFVIFIYCGLATLSSNVSEQFAR